MNCKGIFSRKLFVRQLDQYFDMTKVYYTVYKICNVLCTMQYIVYYAVYKNKLKNNQM